MAGVSGRFSPYCWGDSRLRRHGGMESAVRPSGDAATHLRPHAEGHGHQDAYSRADGNPAVAANCHPSASGHTDVALHPCASSVAQSNPDGS